MKKKESLSKRVFLEAARIMAECECGYSCIAIPRARRKITKKKFMYSCKERKKFTEIMLDEDEESKRFYNEPHLRVIALCLMAAMEG